jgi:hypothetical protein
VISSATDQSGSLKINLLGEDARYPLEIVDARRADGAEVRFTGSRLNDLELAKDTPIKILVKLASSKKYVIGVSEDGA